MGNNALLPLHNLHAWTARIDYDDEPCIERLARYLTSLAFRLLSTQVYTYCIWYVLHIPDARVAGTSRLAQCL